MRRLISSIAVVLVTACGSDRVPTSPTAPTAAGSGVTQSAAGTFEITFTADAACTELPPEARSRTYIGSLALGGASITTLSGANFVPSGNPYPVWNVLYTKIANGSGDIWFQDPPIWEALSSTSYVLVFGDAHGQIGADTATMPFWGRFEYCSEREADEYPECEVAAITCESARHTLTLRRK